MSTEIKTREITLSLEGLRSEHCAMIIDEALSKLQGVNAHRVELNNQRAVIAIEKAEVVSEAINAIKKLGYGVTTLKKMFPVLKMSCAS
ncbi:MAG: cation transporter, partial [Salinivirgaceae bacterium]|nr:cation transporter [Salinivirgaceae bacterium]